MFRVASSARLLIAFLTATASVAISSSAATAQSTGTVRGVLRDSSGGVLPGGSVVLVNLATSQRQETVSSEAGMYTFVFLAPGDYRLEVQLAGFRPVVRERVTVNVAGVHVVDFVLEVADVAETLTVTGDAPLLQVDTAALGGLVENYMLTAMPMSSRNFTQILALAPGVSGDITDAGSLGRNSVNISAGGARPHDNSMVLDGVVADNQMSLGFDDSSDKTGVPVPSPDAIQEFRVMTGLYDAEYGRQGGAVVNVVTKSGGNSFTGSAYEFFRDDALNANEFFRKRSGQPKPVLEQNQFGATLGGPLMREKLFFFSSYQGTRQVNGGSAFSTRSVFIPAIGDRSARALGALYGGQSGIFGGTSVASDGSNINPVALAVLNARLPNGQYVVPDPQTTLATGSGFAAFSEPATFREDQVVTNFDYTLSQAHRLGVKVFFSTFPSELPFSTTGGSNVPGFGESLKKRNFNTSLSHTWLLSNTAVNQLRIGYVRNVMIERPTEPLLATQLGMRPAVPEFPGIASIGITGGFRIGLAANNDQHTFINTYEISDTLNVTRGRHSLRFGGSFSPVFVDRTDPYQTRGTITFSSFPDFLLGMSASQNGTAFSNVSSANVGNGIHHREPRFVNAALFAQDDFRVNERLSLNLGLRWQFNSQQWDESGHNAGFDMRLVPRFQIPPDTGTLRGFTVPNNADLLGKELHPDVVRLAHNRLTDEENWLGFSPRVGLTYRPFNDIENLIVRAGYGLFHSSISGTNNEQAWFGPWFAYLASGGANVPESTFQNPFPNVPPSDAFPFFLPYKLPPEQSFFSVSPLNQQPFTQQWSVNTQYNVGSWLAEVGYVGSKSKYLMGSTRPNQAVLVSPENPINGLTTNTVQNRNLRVPVIGVAPGSISMRETLFRARHHGLQLTLSKRQGAWLGGRVSYTLSRTIDNLNASTTGRGIDSGSFTGDYYNIDGNEGPASYDRTHRLVMSYVWNLPRFDNSSAVTRGFLGGWSFAGVATIQSGRPFSITDSRAGTIYGVAAYGQFAPGMGVDDVPLEGATDDRLSRYFNTSAFGPPPVIGNGTGFGNVPRNAFRGPGQANVDVALSKVLRIGGLRDSATLEFRVEAFNLFNASHFGQPGTNVATPASFGVISETIAGPRIMQLAMRYVF